MEEGDDDFYEPSPATESGPVASESTQPHAKAGPPLRNQGDPKTTEDLEEGEEEEDEGDDEDDDSDSDIDIITTRKDGTKPEPAPPQSRHNTIRTQPGKATQSDGTSKPTPQPKSDAPQRGTPPKTGAEYPLVRTSKMDVDANPVYEPAGKPITEVNMDEDLKEHDKPWREPGTDVSDYYNYGFDEFTWSLYCLKQEKIRAGIQEDKKGFGMVMEGGLMGMPGLPPAGPGGAQAGMSMPGMPGMPEPGPEMMAQMAQMAQMMGMDPSQMDPSQMDAMFGVQQGHGGANNQGQGFGGGQQGYGAQGQGQQQMGFGFDPTMMGNDPGRNRPGNFAGRGRGGNRRNW